MYEYYSTWGLGYIAAYQAGPQGILLSFLLAIYYGGIENAVWSSTSSTSSRYIKRNNKDR